MKHRIFCRAVALTLTGLLVLSPLQALAAGAAPVVEDWKDVEEIKPVLVDMVPREVTLEEKSTKELTATVSFTPSGASQPVKPTWSVREPGIASVQVAQDDPLTATVSAVSPGLTTVTVSLGENLKAECDVIVSGVVLERTSLDLFVNQEESLSAPRYGSVKDAVVRWESSNISVAEVENGKITAHYPGEAVITAKAGRYEAKCTVRVREDVAETIPTNLDGQRLCRFSGIVNTLDSRCREKTGVALERVTGFSVRADQGMLCYGYISPDAQGHGIGGSESCYVNPRSGQMGLNDVTFVPQSGFSGTAEITYTGYSTGGQSFQGSIRVRVDEAEDVTYTTRQGRDISFAAEDFQAVCQARTGRSASYLTFDQPPENKGALYRNYTVSGEYAQKIDSSTRIQVAGAEREELLSFVPDPEFYGTLTVPYRCVDSYGSSFEGKVTITVDRETGPAQQGEVRLDVREGKALRLNGYSFDSVCRSLNGRPMRYLRFDRLPDTREGVLYYDYNSSNETLVNTSTAYVSSGNPSLSRITFLPGAGFTGEVVIPFGGVDSGGYPFQGTLVIRVEPSGQANNRTITYYAPYDGVVPFLSEDFDWACRTATGNALNYVRFRLPASNRGHLYLKTSSSSTVPVRENTNYYREGRRELLDDVFFRAPEQRGTFYINFTGWSIYGQSFSGTVAVLVNTNQTAKTRYFGSSLPVALHWADFQSTCRSVTGGDLRTIRFTALPDRSVGVFQEDGRPVRTQTAYTSTDDRLEHITFVARAGYEGLVRVPYEGTDNRGHRFQGTLELDISGLYAPNSFRDMAQGWDWARPSVEYMRYLGVTKGCGSGLYCPARSVSRGEYVAMVCRAFGFTSSAAPGFTDVLPSSFYASAIAAARERGIISGAGGAFRPNEAITREDAFRILYEALRAAGHGLPGASDSLLTFYADGNQVPAAYRPAFAALIQQGVVKGDNHRCLRPGAQIGRAEIAVILHRALTL